MDKISIVKCFGGQNIYFVEWYKIGGIVLSILNRILLLLETNNKTQKELMAHLGLEKSTFTAWKGGKNNSYMKYLPQIADYFHVSVDWLTGKSQFKNNNAVGEYYSGWNNYYDTFEPPFDFCPLLKEIRKEKGISSEEMAEVINASVEKYKECEDGIEAVTYEQAEKLCNFLGTNTSQVLFDNGVYNAEVPEEYHKNIRKWEISKKIIYDEAIDDSSNNLENEDIKIVARHLEEIPSDKRQELIKTINSTISMYKKAIGVDKKED